MKSLLPMVVFCFFFTDSFSQINEAINLLEIEKKTTATTPLPRCGTPDPTPAQYAYTRDVIANISLPENAGTTGIPIHIFIVRNDDGSGGIDPTEINEDIANANLHFLAAGIEFYITHDSPTYIDETDYYEYHQSEETALATLGGTLAGSTVNNAANMFFVNSITTNSGGGACGYAYFPFNSQTSLRILMANGCTGGEDNGTFTHELGHWFSLHHTHNDTENGNTDPDAEHVPRSGANSNCSIAGDLICDTAADPNGSNDGSCNFVNNGMNMQDIHGNTYDPDLDNIMSYYSDGCGGNFKAGQATRAAQGLIERQGYGSYPLTRAAATVTNPSGLTATEDASTYTINLSWTDNASNEFGYVIERSSTSSSAGFSTLSKGGVNANVFTFSDATVESNTTYWYRVKASNDDPNHYSNVATVTTGLLYCLPTHHTSTCTVGGIGMGIDDFLLEETDGTDLINNQNNGCSNTFTNFKSTLSANLTSGATYDVDIVVPIAGGCYNHNIRIFIDLNQDGDYEDAGELILSGASSACAYNDSFSVPLTALNGTTSMRVRVFNSGNSSNSPCGYASYGETEEYGLVISGAALPIELTSFTANAKEDQVQLKWTTASEINNDYFIVERSINGKNFEMIDQINGAGNSQSVINYQTMDHRPIIGDNYYRLKQVDFNGSYAYSDIQVINFEAAFTAQISPNPTRNGQINLDINSMEEGEVLVQLRDIQGRLIQNHAYWVKEGMNTNNIQSDNLPKGIYLMRIQKGQSMKTIRVVNN